MSHQTRIWLLALLAIGAVALGATARLAVAGKARKIKLHLAAIPGGDSWFCYVASDAGGPVFAGCGRTPAACRELQDVTEGLSAQYGVRGLTRTLDCVATDEVWASTAWHKPDRAWHVLVAPSASSCEVASVPFTFGVYRKAALCQPLATPTTRADPPRRARLDRALLPKGRGWYCPVGGQSECARRQDECLVRSLTGAACTRTKRAQAFTSGGDLRAYANRAVCEDFRDDTASACTTVK